MVSPVPRSFSPLDPFIVHQLLGDFPGEGEPSSEQQAEEFHDSVRLADAVEAMLNQSEALSSEGVHAGTKRSAPSAAGRGKRTQTLTGRVTTSMPPGTVDPAAIFPGVRGLLVSTSQQAQAPVSRTTQDEISALLRNGREHMDANNAEGALDCFNRCLEQDPKCCGALMLRAITKSKLLSHHAAAIQDLDRAIEINPASHRCLFMRANTKMLSGQNYEAFNDVSEAIRLSPMTAEYWSLRSLIKTKINLLQEGLADALRAIHLDPRNFRHWLRVGSIRFRMKQYSGALEACNSALSLQPLHPIALGVRGMTEVELGRFEEAICALETVFRLPGVTSNPLELSDIHLFLGRAYAGLGRFVLALEEFDRALSMNLGNNRALLERGKVYMTLKDYWRAIESFERVTSPADPSVLEKLQEAKRLLENPDAYRDLISFEAVTSPADPSVLEKLQEAKRLLENPDAYPDLISDAQKSAQSMLDRLGNLQSNPNPRELKNVILCFKDALDASYYSNEELLKQLQTLRIERNWNEVVILCTAALETDKKNAAILWNRAVAWKSLRNYRNALVDIDRALELTTTVNWLVFRAEVKYSLKDFGGAQTDLEAAMQRNLGVLEKVKAALQGASVT